MAAACSKARHPRLLGGQCRQLGFSCDGGLLLVLYSFGARRHGSVFDRVAPSLFFDLRVHHGIICLWAFDVTLFGTYMSALCQLLAPSQIYEGS